ncbi:glutamate synthase large subunit [Leptospira interrogans]|uniref:glutamate synthase large subunit n=1 Tax=Leptospira interrogans TaxID=173 RepID=UPI000773BBBA|nr:glutamate synthase large subunit [Leptospira interrogans]WML93407.1 glutamate synthase large subunit [Leptospira interrogans]
MNDLKEQLQLQKYLEENGLYEKSFEHDNCGVGFVASYQGENSHRIVSMGLKAVACLTHRGAVDADMVTGDGAGIMIQIPKKLFATYIEEMGHRRPDEDSIGVGMIFLPREDIDKQDMCRSLVESALMEFNFKLYAWRYVPVNPEVLGPKANQSRPQIEQVLIGKPEGMSNEDFETKLFLIQKKLMRDADRHSLAGDLYICSLSSERIVFKGLFNGNQVSQFYDDLNSEEMVSPYCIFHQRYSTNTFPSWALAQPFRILAHNGEINTIAGNRIWMLAREEELECKKWGEYQKEIHPIIRPHMSDSASLDNAMEAIVRSGKDVLQAKAMLVPNAWSKNLTMSEELKSFYEYNNTLIEPWDGPAALAFAEGDWIGGALDRNGLRPARYAVTEDGLLVMGSEAGLVQVEEELVIKKGRLGPGEMIGINLKEKKLYYNEDINSLFEKKYDYREWSKENVSYLNQDLDSSINETITYKGDDLRRRQILFAYSPFKQKSVIKPQAHQGKEAISSMGDDTPLSILMLSRIGLYTYFRQRFAQVTNPPIDYMREKGVTSLYTRLVKKMNLFGDEKPQNCLVLSHPYLTNLDLKRIREMEGKPYKILTLDATFEAHLETEASQSRNYLETALDALLEQALKAATSGTNILILSDKKLSKERAPIPMELAVAAVHNHLIRNKTRSAVSILVETGSAFEIHNVAVLLGYGASGVNSYLIWDTLFDLWEKGEFDGEDGARPEFYKICGNYRYGVDDGLLKIMSKMGISILSSYVGGQVFEAIGLSRTLVSKYFPGTYSRISGIGIGGIEQNILRNHEQAFYKEINPEDFISEKDDQPHRWSPRVVKFLRKAAVDNDYEAFKEATKILKESDPINIRDLFDFVAKKPIPIEEVETVTEIQKRFLTPGMSHGALSIEAHTDLAIAMNRLGAKSSSGEGGENPSRYVVNEKGDLANSSIKQIASGRFGVTSEYLNSATEIEIKIAQGAKPGEGGQLPGKKNNEEIATNRHTPMGIDLISPPPHHDIYSIEDLSQLIYDLKMANHKAQVSVKLVSEAGVGTIAAGVAKANADVILISGHVGGTGAAPITSIKYAGSPWELGLSETHQVLVMNGLRDRVVLRTDGGIVSGRDVIIAACLGAEEYGVGTASLVALGCIMARKCHLNNCPTGIATQDIKFRAKYKGSPDQLVNLFTCLALEVREYLAELGFRSIDEIIGRTDLLKQITRYERDRLDSLDLNPILVRLPLFYDPTKQKKDRSIRKEPVGEVLDDRIIKDAEKALEGKSSMALSYLVRNTNRTVGAKISGLIARKYGSKGLPGKLEIILEGTAGQSLGAWLVKGVQVTLHGDANDYVGKGLCGGVIVIKKHRKSKFKAYENTIIGNTCLYGATSGKLFCSGRAGERFGVRNSGAEAVVGGAGDHFLEYMTSGTIVCLGSVGKNMGAGMTGGTAYFFQKGWDIQPLLNKEYVRTVDLENVDYEIIKNLISEHSKLTSSDLSEGILKDFEANKNYFVKVVPK